MYRRILLSVYQSRNAVIHAHETCLLSPRSAPLFRSAIQGCQRALGTSGVSYCEKKEGPIPLSKEEVKKDGEKTEELQVEAKKDVEAELKIEATKDGEQEPLLKMEVKNDGETDGLLKTEAKKEGESERVIKIEAKKEGEIESELTVEANTEGEKVPELKMDAKTAEKEEAELKMEAKTEAGSEEVLNMEAQNDAEKMVELKVEAKYGKVEREVKAEAKKQGEREKSGKESLLELLGAMKVEVTTKRKFKALKAQRSNSEAPAKPEPMESTISMFKNATAEVPTSSENLSPELVAAASAAASTLPNRSLAESELLRQLRKHEAVADAQRTGDVQSIGTIIADMKVGKKPNGRPNARPTNQIRFDDDGRGYTHDRGITSELDGVRRRKSVFSGKRINIFSVGTEQEAQGTDLVSAPTLWDIDLGNQIVLSTNQIPRNGFEEMIQWTKEGKLWQYPINNEAGLEEEASVPFHEHVFLEKHLAEGFPRQGPVRHFMELVVSGLSKNPHLTVRQKQEHIAWFRDYFQQKEDVLKEAEVFLN